MLRAVGVGIASWALAASCALTEPPPPPPNTRLLVVEVQNGFGQLAQIAVGTGQGLMQGAAEPATVPPRSTMHVNVIVPLGPAWTIVVNGEPVVMGADLNFGWPELEAGDIVIGIDPDGNTFWRCKCL